ncbi:leucine-rich repeat protein [Cellulophaga sp. E16_2]|uniref:Epidermal growth-factor receptor (EGFR) L domain protein n=1 Tax=Cellulophaga algicola (strain DSM 14237 / IC166 / ACAM 630) TaxID=688270 RepID=E6XCL3_CELAD|nr:MULTISPECIES: leucine-rich repeat protein [Cellulophaga]ADV49002.1 epidermal growth-factor receptor (EGFR) L domain protein [Cellulophaga algicola DSM 14237]MBO0591457.1 leucine-rich repeat protein [Cellulophaga sp. E16_2]
MKILFIILVIILSTNCQLGNEKKTIEPELEQVQKISLIPTKDNIVYSGDLSFTTQKQIDSFTKNKKYDFIDGSLKIINTEDIFNLDGLSSIEVINGELMISVVKNLTSVKGLRNIEKVNGDFTISGTRNLEKIDSFNNLESINGMMIFGNDYGLTEISSFNELLTIEDLYFSGCSDLVSLHGFNKIETIDKISISGASVLDEITNFKNLKKIKKTISIEHNSSLKKISLQKIDSINEYMVIHENRIFNGNLNIENVKYINKLYIWSNSSFSNYCEISKLIIEKKIDSIDFLDNRYNPTRNDLTDSNCNK